jgi:tetratricopeptide (TPR) repeat protein
VRLTLAFLADFALAHPDGKLYVTGGGLHQLRFAALPGIYPYMSLALEVQFDPTERSVFQAVDIEVLDPRGEAFLKAPALSVGLPPSSIEVTGSHAQLVINWHNLTFHHEGQYVFNVRIGTGPRTSIPLEVVLDPGSATSISAVHQTLEQGFAAFTAGDLDAAEQRFRAAIDAIPTLGVAHNDIGFVQLTKGLVEEALISFNRALETGFDRLELLEANMACCFFRLGNYEASLALFQNCLSIRSFSGGAVLHGLGPQGLFLVSLPSAGTYTRLMGANAAWSAHRAGRDELAERFLAMAEGIVGLPEDPGLSVAMSALRSELQRGE